MECLNLDSRSTSACIVRKTRKAFTSICCRYFNAKHFPYWALLYMSSTGSFQCHPGLVVPSFCQVEVVSKVSADLPGTILGDPDTLCLWPKLWDLWPTWQPIPSCRSLRKYWALMKMIGNSLKSTLQRNSFCGSNQLSCQPSHSPTKIETRLRSWRLEIHEGWTHEGWTNK